MSGGSPARARAGRVGLAHLAQLDRRTRHRLETARSALAADKCSGRLQGDPVHVTPQPVFAGLERLDQRVPHRMEVRYGDKRYANLKINSYKFAAAK